MGNRPRDARPRSAPPMTPKDPMPEYERLRAVVEAQMGRGDDRDGREGPPDPSG